MRKGDKFKMGSREKEVIIKTNSTKLSLLKNLVEARIKEIDPDSLISKDELESKKITEAVILMGLLNDINKSIEIGEKEISLSMTPESSFCFKCLKETETFVENQVYCCRVCGSAK
jgi:hypothetical protein